MTCMQSTESFGVVNTRMKYSIIILLFAFAGCGHGGDHPDVSDVAVGEIHIERFDTAFFSRDDIVAVERKECVLTPHSFRSTATISSRVCTGWLSVTPGSPETL